MVRVTGFEPAASCSQSRRATNCATPGYLSFSSRCAYSPKCRTLPTVPHPNTVFECSYYTVNSRRSQFYNFIEECPSEQLKEIEKRKKRLGERVEHPKAGLGRSEPVVGTHKKTQSSPGVLQLACAAYVGAGQHDISRLAEHKRSRFHKPVPLSGLYQSKPICPRHPGPLREVIKRLAATSSTGISPPAGLLM